MGSYASDGSIRITVVDGTDLTGLHASDGSWYVVPSLGTIPVGVQHPCGAYWVTVVDSSSRGIQAPDGSLYVQETPYTYQAGYRVTVVSGSLGTPTTPVLALLTSSQTAKPQFSLLTDVSAAKDDVLRLRYSTDSSFGSFVDLEMTLGYLSVSTADVLSAITALSDATYYFKAKHERGSDVSDWSNTVTATITAASVPSTITYTQRSAPTVKTVPSFTNKAIPFDGVDIGGLLDAGRYLAVSYGYIANAIGTDVFVDFLDGNGPQAATKDIGVAAIATNRGNELWKISAPIGGIVDIVVVAGNHVSAGIIAGTLHALASATPAATQANNTTTPADDYTMSAITTPTPGLCIATVNASDQAITSTWKGGFTKQAHVGVNPGVNVELATNPTAGSVTPSLTRGNFLFTSSAVAAYTGV